MLKKKFTEGKTLSSNIFLSSEDHTSDRDFVFQETLDFETIVNINPIIDLESVEYLPESDKIEVDMFFLKYLSKDDIIDISQFIEPEFMSYAPSYYSFNEPKSELFEITDSDGLIKPLTNNEASLSPLEISSLKPQILVNPISEITKNYPTKTGYPHFYNTFTFPFWDSKDVWTENSLGFDNKPYTYNSFMLIEVYDDFNVETQKLITTIPVYVSDRYMFQEEPSKDSLGKQKRPVFDIMEGVDGYSLFFMKDYKKNDLYVKYYFWDALNGRRIQFVPSGKNNLPKKWLQSTKDFNQKDLYLKYELDYQNRSYKILDLNKNSGEFSINVTNHIDLYELGYDDYWVNYQINNQQPTDIEVVVPPRTFGNLVISETSINTNILYSSSLPTLSSGIKNLPSYEAVSNEYISRDYYNDYNGQNYYNWGYLHKFDIKGNEDGFLFSTKNTSLNKKTISLLDTKYNLCVNTEIPSHKESSGFLLIENTGLNPVIIESVEVSNLLVECDEDFIDLSNSGSLTHKIKQSITSEPSIYHETTILPKLKSDIVELIKSEDSKAILDEVWSEYKYLNGVIDSFYYQNHHLSLIHL